MSTVYTRDAPECSWQLCIRRATNLATFGPVPLAPFCADHEHEFMIRLGRLHYEDNPTEAVEGLASYERERGYPLTDLPNVPLPS